MRLTICTINNEDIAHAGGYPCIKFHEGKVHALMGCQDRYGTACGMTTWWEAHYTKEPLDCQRCQAVIDKEAKPVNPSSGSGE